MSHSKINADRLAAMAEIEAEDRAINYLATLPAEVAKGAAVKAALVLFAVLETESQAALCEREPDPAEILKAEERGWLASDLAKYSQHKLLGSYPDECVRRLLQGLSARSAVFVALAIVEHVFCSECSP